MEKPVWLDETTEILELLNVFIDKLNE